MFQLNIKRCFTRVTFSRTHIERLSKLQKRAAHIILHAEFNTPSDTLFRELGLFSVPNRINFNKAVFTYRALNDLTPEY